MLQQRSLGCSHYFVSLEFRNSLNSSLWQPRCNISLGQSYPSLALQTCWNRYSFCAGLCRPMDSWIFGLWALKTNWQTFLVSLWAHQVCWRLNSRFFRTHFACREMLEISITKCDSCETHVRKTTPCTKDPSHEDRKHETHTTCDPCERNPSWNQLDPKNLSMKIETYGTHAPCIFHSLSQSVFLIMSPKSV